MTTTAEDLPGDLRLRALGDDEPLVDCLRTGSVSVSLGPALSVSVVVSPSKLQHGAAGVSSAELTESVCETGSIVWDGAVVLGRWLHDRVEAVRDKRVVELGAGHGLVGTACAKMGAAFVSLTDLPHRLEALRDTIERNGVSNVEARVLDWTRDGEFDDRFDVALAADCVYDLELVWPLIQALRRRAPEAFIAVDTSIRRRRAYDRFDTALRATFEDVSTEAVGDVAVYRARGPRPLSLVLMGVCGSGKTTLGRALGVAFVDGDHLHPPVNVDKMTRGEPLTDHDRDPWLQSCAKALCGGSGPVAVACSALKAQYRERLAAAARDARRRLCFVYLRADVDLIRRRIANRPDHFMPPTLVDSQFVALEPPDRLREPAFRTADLLVLDAAQPLAGLSDEVRALL